MDNTLLNEIFIIPAPSGQEDEMKQYIKDYLYKYKISYIQDEYGNIYNIDNKNSPILSAHMDTVQDDTDCKLVKFIKIKNDILKGYGVIGADDKCGIYIILKLLQEYKWLNFVFSSREETMHGSIINFIRNDIEYIPYGLVLDRRGKSDIICGKNNYGTKELEKYLVENNFGFRSVQGVFSDADYLSNKISVSNISVGYYNPHSKKEFVKLSELENSYKFVEYVINNNKNRYEKPIKTFDYGKRYSYYEPDNYEDWYVDRMTSDECEFCGEKDVSILFTLKSINKVTCENCFNLLSEEIISLNYDGV